MKTDIKNLLKELTCYLEFTRRVGHTSQMIKGIEHTSFFTENIPIVVVHDQKTSKYIKNELKEGAVINTMSFNQINNYSLRGYAQPLSIDNAALQSLCAQAYNYIDDLETKLSQIRYIAEKD